MTGRVFNHAAAADRLGLAAVDTARRLVDEAPPLSAEQVAQLRAVFASARPRTASRPAA